MSKDDIREEAGLRAAAESLLKSWPDLADPNKLRKFQQMLDQQIASRPSAGSTVLPDRRTADRAPARPTPEGRFLWFVLDLGVGLWPAIFIAATFPRFPLPILPAIVLVGFFASPHLFKAERPGRQQDKLGDLGA